MSTLAFALRALQVRIGQTTVLHGVDLELETGGFLGVVGQSGSGKSMTAKALSGLLPAEAVASGEYQLDGVAIPLGSSASSWRRLRGQGVVWLPQDPFTSLDPLRPCGAQILAGHRDLRTLGRREREAEVAARLDEVGLPSRIATAYPHELSGGMRQRVAIASALAPDPKLFLADEPTTALDASSQAGILDLLNELRRERAMSLVLITHDLLLAQERCERLAVFHDGRVVEHGPAAHVVANPQHEHTRELIAVGLRRQRSHPAAAAATPVLIARGIGKTYLGSDRPALIDADLEVRSGEIVGIVGESGSGKTTLARCLLGLEQPDTGHFGYLEGSSEHGWSPRQAQLVFQNPYASLNPSMTVRATLVEALRTVGRPAGDVDELLELVQLDRALAERKPFRLSGGERQRVAIARALAPRPRVLFCDEAVSALDAAVQARILTTLVDLRDRLGLAIVFITHDLTVVDQIASRVSVVYRGRIVETGRTDEVLTHPQHEYTRVLVDAIPKLRSDIDRVASERTSA